MKKWTLILLAAFFCSACLDFNKETPTLAEIDYKMSEEWIYATKIFGPKNNGEVFLRPPGVEQFVMGFMLPSEGGVVHKMQCVYYRIPYKTKLGKLSVFELKNTEECPENAPDEDTFLVLDNLTEFKVSMQNFKLKMEFELEKSKKNIEITLMNLKLGEVHEKYLPLKEKNFLSGLKFLKMSDESFDSEKNKYLGKLSDRFSKGNAIRCQQVNKNCETIGENRCSECRYGWYEVVDFQCPQGGSKFCGQNHCGEKNEPACPRGNKIVFEDEAGICQSDLEPVANADKILVCQ